MTEANDHLTYQVHLKVQSKLDLSTIAAANKTNQLLELTPDKNFDASRFSAFDVSKQAFKLPEQNQKIQTIDDGDQFTRVKEQPEKQKFTHRPGWVFFVLSVMAIVQMV